jgi:hypothetical protein
MGKSESLDDWFIFSSYFLTLLTLLSFNFLSFFSFFNFFSFFVLFTHIALAFNVLTFHCWILHSWSNSLLSWFSLFVAHFYLNVFNYLSIFRIKILYIDCFGVILLNSDNNFRIITMISKFLYLIIKKFNI